MVQPEDLEPVFSSLCWIPQSVWSLSAGTESKRQRTVSERKLKSLDGLYIVGREESLAAIFAETPPPGFVNCFHIHDDVPWLERNLCVIL